jgi:hypothetical protein
MNKYDIPIEYIHKMLFNLLNMDSKEDQELIEFINATFPTYESLTGIDDVLKNLNVEV